MIDQAHFDTLLRRVDALGRELEQLRRDLLLGFSVAAGSQERKPTLYGIVRADDITEEMIEEAQHEVFRDLDDLSSF